MPAVVPPAIGPDDEYFWEGARAGKLLLQRCRACGEVRHPPVPMCPECGSLEWQPQEAAGRGTVFSWIVSRHPNKPDDEPRIVAVVELDEGIGMVTNLQNVDPSAVENEMAVEVCFTEFDGGVVLPQFRPVAHG
jgi:uncharacterized OB-fold protein